MLGVCVCVGKDAVGMGVSVAMKISRKKKSHIVI